MTAARTLLIGKARENTPGPEKNGLVCCFNPWRVCFLKNPIPGPELRAPAKPVAGTRFSRRDGAPSHPPLPLPLPLRLTVAIQPNSHDCGYHARDRELTPAG
jgi:hypothetical protein